MILTKPENPQLKANLQLTLEFLDQVHALSGEYQRFGDILIYWNTTVNQEP